MAQWFARFSARTATLAGHWQTFIIALLLVVLWALTGPFFAFSDTWQLIINTATTIVTFLLVALLQNTQTRSDEAIHQKLNAMADALADLMSAIGEDKPGLRQDLTELRKAVGLEDRESA